MPIETTKTVVATTAHSPAELIDALRAEARKRLADPPVQPLDAVRLVDQEVYSRAMLLGPDGVVLSYDPADRRVVVLCHNVDGFEVALALTLGQIEKA